jgi:hypothetical protein
MSLIFAKFRQLSQKHSIYDFRIVVRKTLHVITNILEEHVPSINPVCSSQMSLTIYQSSRCHNPEDHSMKLNRCENFDRVGLCTYCHVSNAVSMLLPVTGYKRAADQCRDCTCGPKWRIHAQINLLVFGWIICPLVR